MSDSLIASGGADYFRHGQATAKTGDMETAIAHFKKAAAAGEDSAEFNHDFGTALAACWDYDAALERLKRAVLITPEDQQILNNLGNVHQALGQLEEALELYLRAEKYAKNSPDVIINVAMLYGALGQQGKAINRYKRVVKMHPNFVIGHLRLAQCELALGKPNEAMKSINQCLRRAPTQQEALALKAIVLKELGRDEQSRDLFDYHRFVRSYKMKAPEGYDSTTAFNIDLHQYLEQHPTNRYSPIGTRSIPRLMRLLLLINGRVPWKK